MTNEDIIRKVVDKAIVNGYQFLFSLRELIFKPAFNEKLPQDVMYGIIFSHSLAKAFWGEEEVGINMFTEFKDYGDEKMGGHEIYKFAWQYHLQQMVLEENPIKYLEKFL